jgi:hypothetical protein
MFEIVKTLLDRVHANPEFKFNKLDGIDIVTDAHTVDCFVKSNRKIVGNWTTIESVDCKVVNF